MNVNFVAYLLIFFTYIIPMLIIFIIPILLFKFTKNQSKLRNEIKELNSKIDKLLEN